MTPEQSACFTDLPWFKDTFDRTFFEFIRVSSVFHPWLKMHLIFRQALMVFRLLDRSLSVARRVPVPSEA